MEFKNLIYFLLVVEKKLLRRLAEIYSNNGREISDRMKKQAAEKSYTLVCGIPRS